MTSAERILIEILIVAALASGLVLYLEHRGAAKVEASDAKALEAASKQAAAETALNVERANKADEVADASQKAIDAYVAAHPDQPVRVCHANNSQPRVPPNKAPNGGTQSPSPGPDPLPAVQNGTPGPDIGPGLAILVQAAATMGTLYRDCQQR